MSRKESFTRRDFLATAGMRTSALLINGVAQTPAAPATCDPAYRLVRKLFTLAKSSDTKYDRGGVMPNLFCSHPLFQIDSNFGGTAGTAEMLLQSHTGELHLLPALPAAWATGQAHGLCARGGLVVDINWRAGKLIETRRRAKIGGVCVVRYGEKTIELRTEPGQVYRLDGSRRKLQTSKSV